MSVLFVGLGIIETNMILSQKFKKIEIPYLVEGIILLVLDSCDGYDYSIFSSSSTALEISCAKV